MRRTLLCALLVCGACDDGMPTEGTRGPCAAGGQVLDDPRCFAVETPEDACWKLVDCGVILLLNDADPNAFDWDNCVARIEGMQSNDQRFALACVEAASCDQLDDGGGDPDCLEHP